MKDYQDTAVSYEKVHFVKTDKAVSPKKANIFLEIPGESILVTAAYSVRYMERKVTKPSNECTGAIAAILHDTNNCYTLAISKFYGGNANVDVNCPFKDRMVQIIQDNQIKLFLNIHSALTVDSPDIEFMAYSKPDDNNRYQQLFRESMKEYDFTNIQCIDELSFDFNTVVGCGLANGLSIVDIGIPKSHRVPNNNKQRFNRFIAGLSSFVSKIKF